jgi:hypothetical protein
MKINIFSDYWPMAKTHLKRKYAQLIDSDFEFIPGREDEMMARLQAKTGATRRDLESYFEAERNDSPRAVA